MYIFLYTLLFRVYFTMWNLQMFVYLIVKIKIPCYLYFMNYIFDNIYYHKFRVLYSPSPESCEGLGTLGIKKALLAIQEAFASSSSKHLKGYAWPSDLWIFKRFFKLNRVFIVISHFFYFLIGLIISMATYMISLL